MRCGWESLGSHQRSMQDCCSRSQRRFPLLADRNGFTRAIPQVDTGKSLDNRRDGLSHPIRQSERPSIGDSSQSNQVLHSVYRSPSRRHSSSYYGPSSIDSSADSGVSLARPHKLPMNQSLPLVDKRSHGTAQLNPRRYDLHVRRCGAHARRGTKCRRTSRLLNTAVQETTGVTPFQLVNGRKVTTMLGSMLPHEPVEDRNVDADVIS